MAHAISKPFNAKELVKFTLPSIIMMMFISVYSLVNGVLAANFVGQEALSTITIVFPMPSIILAISIMFAAGSNAIIAANMGAQKPDVARENFTRIVLTGFIVGTLITILTLIFKEPLVTFLGAGPELQELCERYLTVYSIGFPFFFMQIFCQFYFVTIGKPIYSMTLIIGAGILNMAVAYFAMGVLDMGIEGAAIGPLISFLLPGIFFIVYFAKNKNNSLYFVKPKMHKRFLSNTMLNGSSELVINLAIAVVTVVMNKIMMSLVGVDGVAAIAVLIQVQFLFNSLFIGFVSGVSPVFGYAYGAKNYTQIKTVFKLSIRIVIVCSTVLLSVAIVMADNIVGFYLAEGTVAHQVALSGFKIFAFVYAFSGFNIFASGFFTAMSNGLISALISFLRTFVFIMGMLLILPPIIGTTGVWLAVPIAEASAFVVATVILLRYRKIYYY